MVPQGFHVRLAAGGGAALGVRGAHVGGVFPNYVGDCALVFHHLLFALVGGDVGETVVGPGMRGDLVTFGDHALDKGRVWGCGVDGAFAKIVARHEECGVEAELLQGVQQPGRVKVWSVIICQGYHICRGAVSDIIVIRNTSEEWSWIIQRRGPCRCSARIASAELPLAIRISTVSFASTTVSLGLFSHHRSKRRRHTYRRRAALGTRAFCIAKGRTTGLLSSSYSSGSAIPKTRLTSRVTVVCCIATVSTLVSLFVFSKRLI